MNTWAINGTVLYLNTIGIKAAQVSAWGVILTYNRKNKGIMET